MKPLVLITYLVLVLAVVGQALHSQGEATGKPTERVHETEKDHTESAREDAIQFASTRWPKAPPIVLTSSHPRTMSLESGALRIAPGLARHPH
jgi:hypothetical protein